VPTVASKQGYEMFNFNVSQQLDNKISEKFRDKFEDSSKYIPYEIRKNMNDQSQLDRNERYAGVDWTIIGPNCVTDTFDTLKESLDGIINNPDASVELKEEAENIKKKLGKIDKLMPATVKSSLENMQQQNNQNNNSNSIPSNFDLFVDGMPLNR
jgi:hypothetical protein